MLSTYLTYLWFIHLTGRGFLSFVKLEIERQDRSLPLLAIFDNDWNGSGYTLAPFSLRLAI